MHAIHLAANVSLRDPGLLWWISPKSFEAGDEQRTQSNRPQVDVVPRLPEKYNTTERAAWKYGRNVDPGYLAQKSEYKLHFGETQFF